MPVLPNLYIPSCDVRDVAKAHVNAMILDSAINNRHIIVNSVECYSLQDFAFILDAEFRPKNYNVPTSLAPNWYIFIIIILIIIILLI
jgi:hypothetical protein